MKLTKLLMISTVLLSVICCISCDEDETTPPMTLQNGDRQIVFEDGSTSLALSIRVAELLLQIKGGDGDYSLSNDNEAVLNATCNGNTITLIPLIIGKANITISDGMGNVLSMLVNVKVDESIATIVGASSCIIYGDKMTDQDKTNLEKEILSPLVEGKGGYRFVNEYRGRAGIVRIYPQELDGSEYEEYNCEYKGDMPQSLIPVLIEAQICYWYVFKSDSKELALFCAESDSPSIISHTRFYLPPSYIYLLDVTTLYKAKYPDLERVYIKQHLKFE